MRMALLLEIIETATGSDKTKYRQELVRFLYDGRKYIDRAISASIIDTQRNIYTRDVPAQRDGCYKEISFEKVAYVCGRSDKPISYCIVFVDVYYMPYNDDWQFSTRQEAEAQISRDLQAKYGRQIDPVVEKWGIVIGRLRDSDRNWCTSDWDVDCRTVLATFGQFHDSFGVGK